MPSFREGIVGTMGQQWDCFVPIGPNNVAVAHWVFGEGEVDKILDHYALAENGDLMLVDPTTASPKPTIERRMGFRPQYD